MEVTKGYATQCRRELKSGKHSRSGVSLNFTEMQYRHDILAVRLPSLPFRQQELDHELLADTQAKIRQMLTDSELTKVTAGIERLETRMEKQEQAIEKHEQAISKLTDLLQKKTPVKGTVSCPHVAKWGKAKGVVCRSFSCTHQARLAAQQEADAAEDFRAHR
jgi:TolA-binding protein